MTLLHATCLNQDRYMQFFTKKFMKKHSLKILILVLFPVLISGIIRHDVDKEKYIELAKKPEFQSVGKIWVNTYFSGSAVLISDKYVLSAANNVIESDTRIDTINNNGQIFYAHVPVNNRVIKPDSLFVEFNGNRLAVEKVIVHPKYLSDIDQGEFDLVLLELKESVKEIAPAKLSFSINELNSNVTGVGYGATGVANKEEVPMKMEKLAGQNIIDSIGGMKENDLAIYMYCDFDSPDDQSTNKLGSPTPRELEYLCAAGDSGGGLFREDPNGNWELIGICKGSEFDHRQFQKTIHYGQIMRWTRISPFEDWISKTACNIG